MREKFESRRNPWSSNQAKEFARQKGGEAEESACYKTTKRSRYMVNSIGVIIAERKSYMQVIAVFLGFIILICKS